MLAVGLGSTIAGGIIGNIGAGKAAATQQKAATAAQQQQLDAARTATTNQQNTTNQQLGTQKQIYDEQQAAQKPYQDTGNLALKELGSGALDGGKLVAPWTKSFDPSTVTMDPGFQMRLDAGNKALMNQMSARGDTLGSNTTKALARFNQDYTSQEYGNAYGRAQQQYQEAYNEFNTNQQRQIQPLMSLAGLGQNANAAAASSGNQYGSNVASIAQQGTSNVNGLNANAADRAGEYGTQGANASASGTVGKANAWTNALTGVSNIALSQLNKPPKPKILAPTNGGGVWTN